jgi:hypothetical protein
MSAFTARIPTVTVDQRVDIITWCLVALAFTAGFGAGLFPRSRSVTHSRTVRESIQSQYGSPSSSVPGAKVSPALSGLTCDVYGSKRTVICR